MNGVVFWILAGAMLLAVGVILIAALRRPPVLSTATDMQVYRDQLAEIDRDLARGTLPVDEADRMRAEVSRRMLAADRQTSALPVTGSMAPWMTGAIALALGGSILGYLWLGAPLYPDVPLADRIAAAEDRRASRPAQAEAEAAVTLPTLTPPDAEYATLIGRLLALLATNEAALGNFAAARTAQQALIAVLGDAVTADDHAALAEILIAAAGGYVSPEAEDILEQALRIDPQNATARYYAGLMMGQNGRYDLGFRFWRPLIDGPADAPWMPPLRAQIEDMAARAGVAFSLPPPAGMTPESMVAQLSDRLATQGGPPEDWARLITGLTVLGQTEQAIAILAEGRSVFAGNPDALAVIEAAAP
jgi:cytochrome c-type biogenesis protein CcmH